MLDSLLNLAEVDAFSGEEGRCLDVLQHQEGCYQDGEDEQHEQDCDQSVWL